LRLLGLLVDRHLHVRGEAAHDELAPDLLDQLLRALRADRGLELVVAEENFDLPAEDAALRVELVDREHRAALLIGGERAEGAGHRSRKSDADRILALRADDGRNAQRGSGGGAGDQERSAIHGSLLGPKPLRSRAMIA